MIDKIKQLSVETVLYGLSTFVGRFINFFLVPFYTNIFPPSEYGIVTNIYAYIAVMNIILLYGMDSAYMKTASPLEGQERKKAFSTAWLGVLFSSTLIGFLLMVFYGAGVSAVSLNPEQSGIYLLAVGVLVFDNLGAIQFVQLRLEQKALLFSLIRIVNIIIMVALNFVLVLRFDLGVEAVFISNFAASFFSFTVVSFFTFKYFAFGFDKVLFKKMAKFALPYLPAGLASAFLQVIDRPIVEGILGLEALGIYQANYRLGIFMMLYGSMFQFAWQPFFLKHARGEDAPLLIGRIFTLYLLIGFVILLFFTFFIENLLAVSVRGVSLIGRDYTSASGIIPIILSAYLCNAVYIFFSVGILLREKSTIVPVFVGTAAIIKISLNLLFLKSAGIYLAAWASFGAYAFLALSFYIYSRKTFPIEFEKKKILLLTVISAVFIALAYSIADYPILAKGVVFLLFPAALMVFGFLRPSETRRLKQLFRR
ncbi:MAG: lipopolysaccharide biosynthesis protein [Ignavibacteriaceae bacterium]|nr:lipopolysaccharide biosynthesis protein [Ignavibacteriaceae bacterium]